MAYVHRNSIGEIDSISETANEKDQEYVTIDNPDLIAYLQQSNSSDDVKVALSTSDVTLIRVLEDLINTLVDQKVILFTDLPLAAREKLSEREKIRGHLTTLDNLMGDDDGIL
jgi:hypothetical protein